MPKKVILLDVEGTTTPISFVRDVLFPYAKANMFQFIRKNWMMPQIQDLLAEMKEAKEIGWMYAGRPSHELMHTVVSYFLEQMKNDKKTPSLKNIQGMIWHEGYENRDLQGRVFPEIVGTFAKWKTIGCTIAIFSSGSVQAQRDLFSNAQDCEGAGIWNVSNDISAYFDTSVLPGSERPKFDSQSYLNICKELKCEPSDVIFATDIYEEALAANKAGTKPVLMKRPGNDPDPRIDKSEFHVTNSLSDAVFKNWIAQ